MEVTIGAKFQMNKDYEMHNIVVKADDKELGLEDKPNKCGEIQRFLANQVVMYQMAKGYLSREKGVKEIAEINKIYDFYSECINKEK